MKPSWSRTEYEREKRNFIQTRLRFRSVYFHSALIFSATWLSGWFFSAVLLKLGLGAMPLRYAVSFVLAYGVFLGAVRVWADFMKSERGSGSWEGGGFDVPVVDAEGCLLALGATLMASVVAGLFALSGGLPLLRKTWRHACVVLVVLCALAIWLHERAPEARTFAQAVQSMQAKEAARK